MSILLFLKFWKNSYFQTPQFCLTCVDTMPPWLLVSTGKRLAKRSILGTRIVAPGHDGRFYPAVIQAVKTYEDRLSENSYTVRFDNSRKVSEFLETDLIGPGFSCVNSLSCLLAGQRVYLTHLGREMEATIMSHDRENDQVVVNLAVGRFWIEIVL